MKPVSLRQSLVIRVPETISPLWIQTLKISIYGTKVIQSGVGTRRKSERLAIGTKITGLYRTKTLKSDNL